MKTLPILPMLKINLLPQKKFSEFTTGEKFLTWATGAGKAIIIITQIVVFGVFAARFKLDQDLIALNDEIEEQIAILQIEQEAEDRIRRLQSKLALIKNLRLSQTASAPTLSEFRNILPKTVTLKTLHLQEKRRLLATSATTPAQTGFVQLIDNLKQSPRFADITLTSSSLDPNTNQLVFSLEIEVAEGT